MKLALVQLDAEDAAWCLESLPISHRSLKLTQDS